jgi:hypothetical protein
VHDRYLGVEDPRDKASPAPDAHPDPSPPGGAPGNDLTERYIEVIDRFGVDSSEAREFLERHADIPGLREFAGVVEELDAKGRAAHRRKWGIRAAWALAFALLFGLGLLSVYRSCP